MHRLIATSMVLLGCSSSASEGTATSPAALGSDDGRAEVTVAFEEGAPSDAPRASAPQDGGPSVALADACTWDLAEAGCE